MNKPRWSTSPAGLLEVRLARSHAVIVLVSVVDRRIVPTLRFVSRLGYADARALHIAIDAGESRQLARDWMNLGLSWLPLHIRDAAGGLTESVCAAVRDQAAATGSVTVVLPELDSDRWWYPLLHRCTARRIATRLQTLDGVTAVIVPFAAAEHVRRRGSRHES